MAERREGNEWQGADGGFAMVPADWVADPLFWLDQEGRFVHANQAGCQALGYSLAELTRMAVWDVDCDLCAEAWQDRDHAALLAAGIKSTARRKDGTTFPVEVRGRLVEMDGKRYCLTTVRDISDFVRIESEVRAGERVIRAILDNIPDNAWMKDLNSTFIAINQASAESCGTTIAEAVGKTDFDFFPPELAARYRADDAAVIASGQRKCVEEPFVGADGVVRWIETIKTPLRDGDGLIVGTVGIFRDITARKAAELGAREMRDMLESLVDERTHELKDEIAAREAADAALIEKQMLLETIIDAATAVIFVKDRDGRYLLVNRRYLALGNWRREDVIGKTDFDLYPRELAEHLKVNDRSVLDGGMPIEFEETVESLEGVRTYISLKMPLCSPAGEVFAVCGIATDITERKEAQALLRQAKEDAEQGSRAKSDFLYVMSHELRTPLNAVIGFAETLLLEYFGTLTAKQRDYVESIGRSGSHLLRIINDILDFAQVDAGRMVLHESAVDVAELFAGSLKLVNLADRRVAVAVPARFPRVWADELRLRQILLNLLSNAVKFSNSGTAIRLQAEIGTDGGLILSVRDCGIGMRREDIPRVLEMFTQLDVPFNRRHTGTGVGLPLAAGLARVHGGSLDIDSEPGRGTTVSVSLPPSRTLPAGEAGADGPGRGMRRRSWRRWLRRQAGGLLPVRRTTSG